MCQVFSYLKLTATNGCSQSQCQFTRCWRLRALQTTDIYYGILYANYDKIFLSISAVFSLKTLNVQQTQLVNTCCYIKEKKI